MASTGEPSVGEPAKISDNNESEITKCRQCKRVVKEKMQCKKCKSIFHPSCLITANKSKNSVCIHEVDEKQEIVDKLMAEIELLKKIIREQEEKHALLMENKKLLEENNKLLRENNDFLQDKIKEKPRTFSEVVSKDGAKSDSIKQQGKKPYKQTRMNDSEKQQGPLIEAGPSNSTKNFTEDDRNYLLENTESRKEITGLKTNEKISTEDNREKSNGVKNYYSKNKKPLFYGTSAEESIKGIPRRIWFFVSRLSPEMTEENLKLIIEKQCPNANIIVEKQKLYHDYQSAFKVGVPIELEEKATNSNFWPRDSRINKFNFFLSRRKLQSIK